MTLYKWQKYFSHLNSDDLPKKEKEENSVKITRKTTVSSWINFLLDNINCSALHVKAVSVFASHSIYYSIALLPQEDSLCSNIFIRSDILRRVFSSQVRVWWHDHFDTTTTFNRIFFLRLIYTKMRTRGERKSMESHEESRIFHQVFPFRKHLLSSLLQSIFYYLSFYENYQWNEFQYSLWCKRTLSLYDGAPYQ